MPCRLQKRMKKYKVIIKKYKAVPDSGNAVIDEKCNHELKEIIGLIQKHPHNYTNVLKQAADNKDDKLIHLLVDTLLKQKVTTNKKQVQQIISANSFEVLVILAANGYTEVLHKLLNALPKAQKISKTLILSLITSAAISGHPSTVGSLVKKLLPNL